MEAVAMGKSITAIAKAGCRRFENLFRETGATRLAGPYIGAVRLGDGKASCCGCNPHCFRHRFPRPRRLDGWPVGELGDQRGVTAATSTRARNVVATGRGRGHRRGWFGPSGNARFPVTGSPEAARSPTNSPTGSKSSALSSPSLVARSSMWHAHSCWADIWPTDKIACCLRRSVKGTTAASLARPWLAVARRFWDDYKRWGRVAVARVQGEWNSCV